MIDGFEWNNDKATLNLKKHGVSFEEALTIVSAVKVYVWFRRELLPNTSANSMRNLYEERV